MRWLLAGGLAVLAGVFCTLSLEADPLPKQQPTSANQQLNSTNKCGTWKRGWGSFRVGNWPGRCWRPYSDHSPFNQPIRKGDRTAPHSKQLIRHLIKHPPMTMVAGDPMKTNGNPTYWPRLTDPQFRLHCTAPWGECPVEDRVIRAPREAMPAGGISPLDDPHDATMNVVDQATGWEVSMWNVTRMSEGEIHMGWGGLTRIDGDGLAVDGWGANSAGYGGLAGLVRAEELRSRRIRHALSLIVPCVEGKVYPASGLALTCHEAALPKTHGFPNGARVQLKISQKRLSRLKLEPHQKAILRALRKFGAYVTDTTGVSEQWGFKVESSATYDSFGARDPFDSLAKRWGVERVDYDENGHREAWFDFESNRIPWHKLRVVHECSARREC